MVVVDHSYLSQPFIWPAVYFTSRIYPRRIYLSRSFDQPYFLQAVFIHPSIGKPYLSVSQATWTRIWNCKDNGNIIITFTKERIRPFVSSSFSKSVEKVTLPFVRNSKAANTSFLHRHGPLIFLVSIFSNWAVDNVYRVLNWYVYSTKGSKSYSNMRDPSPTRTT